MNNQTLIRVVGVLVVYLVLKYLGGSFGETVLYPITLFVTFLHEFGHAFGAIITGGSVENLQVSQDGSGFTATRGGNRAITLMGGYLGSALLGNILFYIGARKPKLAQYTLYFLATIMILAGLKWFNSFYTTGVLIAFAVVFYLLAARTKFDQVILMFLGLASILYIIQDFNVGPSSDLEAYAEVMVFLPAKAWMYIWLAIALFLTFINLRMIFKRASFRN